MPAPTVHPGRSRVRLIAPFPISVGRIVLYVFFCAFVAAEFAVPRSGNANDEFEKSVAPILIQQCIECHNGVDRQGGLDLTSQTGFQKGGESGERLDQRDPETNPLLEKVMAGEMPPAERGRSRELKASEKKAFRNWIASGARWPAKRILDLYEFTNEVRAGRDWWSLQSVKRPRVPRLSGTRNPIDAFVRQKLNEHGLDFSPPADRQTLFRRVTQDVTGLPPDYRDWNSFRLETDEAAYERLVDRLLGSPRFGEHFARDWLDLVRYADTNGYERDAEKPNAWKYRDWVIESFNADKPFDLFVLQQIAGDQLNPGQLNSLVGTTMLRVGTWDDEPNDKLEYKYDRLEDLVHVTSTAFLGLTIRCARCHNHKFDPIPQTDYYRMGSIFWPGDLMGNRSDPVQGHAVFAWTDTTSTPPPLSVLKNGDARKPFQIVTPGFLSVFSQLNRDFDDRKSGSAGTDRRLKFARLIVDQRNPLTARVVVNRIWQHYFGRGIVATPNNFGFKGEFPTHPNLLDWLASELMESDWNLKRIHRLILTSRTYKQQSAIGSDSTAMNQGLKRDPDNRLLSRMNRKRLRAEGIRDALLFGSGNLNLEMGGRGFSPDVSPQALEVLSKKSAAWKPSRPEQYSRRGVYLFVRRSLIPPLMANFDFADTTRPCGQRDQTIVAPQALGLLNNRFVHRQSEAMARILQRQSPNVKDQIRLAWQRIFCRQPAPDEFRLAIGHYQSQLDYYRQQVKKQESLGSRNSGVRDLLSRATLHLNASVGVTVDRDRRVQQWKDPRTGIVAAAAATGTAPRLIANAVDEQPAIQFDGSRQFLAFDKRVINSKEFTILVVGLDRNESGHREFVSNWNSAGNSTSSVFLGLTDGRRVRFSDQLRSSGAAPQGPFVLTAVSSSDQARIFVGRKEIGKRAGGLNGRNLTTRFVLGTQGNYGHEYLNGWIARVLIFDKALDSDQLRQLWSAVEGEYPSVKTDPSAKTRLTPESRALASLCHVLLNSNEMIYVD